MRYRTLGSTGPRVSEIGFGCARIGGVFGEGKATADETIRLLRDALDRGITFYDTADIYAQGESEALLGRAFQSRRDKVVIATKAGYCLPTQRRLIARMKPIVRPILRLLRLKRQSLPSAVSGSLSQDFSPAYLTRALESSLRRLRTDHVDFFQLHSPPASALQSGDFLDTLDKLKSQGKTRHYGIAADSPTDALLCLGLPGISAI